MILNAENDVLDSLCGLPYIPHAVLLLYIHVLTVLRVCTTKSVYTLGTTYCINLLVQHFEKLNL